MNTPYVKTYNQKGEVQFPKEGIVNKFPSNRGNRFNPSTVSNRKTTEGRQKRKQFIDKVVGDRQVTIYHPHPNMTSGTWTKYLITHRMVVHLK